MRIHQAVSHIWLCNRSRLYFLYDKENYIFFLSVRKLCHRSSSSWRTAGCEEQSASLWSLALTNSRSEERTAHRVLTYIEYRAVSGWRLPNYWTPHPLSTQRVCPPPAPKAGGEGVGGQYFEDARHLIGLLQYNPSTEQLYRNTHPQLNTFKILTKN